MKVSISIEEACKALGIGRTKLYALINSGHLKAKKCGKRTLVLWGDLEAFAKNLGTYKGE